MPAEPIASVRGRLARAWLAWEADDDSFFPPDAVYDLVGKLCERPAEAVDRPLLAAWRRWLADDREMWPADYLHAAFHDWIERIGYLEAP